MNSLIFHALFSNEDFEKLSGHENGRRFGWSVLLSGVLLAVTVTSFVFLYFNIPGELNSAVAEERCYTPDTQRRSSASNHLLFSEQNENKADVFCCGEPYVQHQVDNESKILLRLDRSLVDRP